MSVCFHLYNVVKDIKFEGCPYDFLTKEERVGDLADSVFDEQFSKKEVGLKFINFNRYLAIARDGKKNGLGRKIKKMMEVLPVQTLKTNVNDYKGVVVEEIAYRQGWFLKKSFFKKACTFYMTTSKKEALAFLDKYLDYNYRYVKGTEFSPAKDCYELVKNRMEDGMIFLVSF